MPGKRKYKSNADRQKAYRERRRERPSAPVTERLFITLVRRCLASSDRELTAFAGALAVEACLECQCGWNPWDDRPIKGTDLTGETLGNLLVHERFLQSTYDKSWVWLCENLDTGAAELWRACDLTRIQRRGQRISRLGASFRLGTRWRSVADVRAKLLPIAEKRLSKIKQCWPVELPK